MLRFEYFLIFTLLIILPSIVNAQDRVRSLAVFVPTAQGLTADQSHLPLIIQGELVANISKHSSISVLDRQRLESVLRENESGIYSNEAELTQLGSVTNVEFHLVGSITRAGQNFVLQLTVVDARKDKGGITRASFSGNVTLADLNNLFAVRGASLDLLTQMGVTVSASTRQELSGAGTTEQVNAQTSLARGITAQKGGTVVEALSYYILASNYDPSLKEAASRVNVLSTNISSGNIGDDTRNDIAWRKAWIERLREAENFFTNYTSQNQPYYLVYETNITWGAINYQNETREAKIWLGLFPDAIWAKTINEVMLTVKDGLYATGRMYTWGLEWPNKSISASTPFNKKNNKYAVVVEIINSDGISIGRQTVNMSYGYFITNTFNGVITPEWDGRNASFPANANLITDKLSIRITSIDNIPAEQASFQKNISIITSTEYNRIPSVLANGMDNNNRRRFTFSNENQRTITGVTGQIDRNFIIPIIYHSIGEKVFSNKGLTNFTIPSHIARIGTGAFENNQLTSITIPSSVTHIGWDAFSKNQLTSVIIPSSVISIGQRAFINNQITSVIMPPSVKELGKFTFDRYSIATNGTITFLSDFSVFYKGNGEQAGVYTWSNNQWSFSPK